MFEARRMPVFFFKIIYFVECMVFRLASVYVLHLLLFAGLL